MRRAQAHYSIWLALGPHTISFSGRSRGLGNSMITPRYRPTVIIEVAC